MSQKGRASFVALVQCVPQALRDVNRHRTTSVADKYRTHDPIHLAVTSHTRARSNELPSSRSAIGVGLGYAEGAPVSTV